MGVFGCTNDGNLNDAKFSEPLPWIGVYIAAASLACLIAMVTDFINGIRHRKSWFPCKFFTINSTSLTLIAVAIKLSVDLNTSMPRREDQLVKLSSSVLMCTIMGNSMPSLGSMENKEIFMNVVALGILVITLIVNICMEMGTGVIYVFMKEHVIIIFLMLVLLGIFSFSALIVPTTKSYLEMKYSVRHNLALKERSSETSGKAAIEKLEEDMVKYWMMAHTCSPQFVIGRSATCTASGAICLLSAATLAEAIFTSYFMHRSFNFCSGESDYKWSITLILIIQCAAVGLGTIAPAFRWFVAINFRCPNKGKINKFEVYKRDFTLERYWVQCLIEMKDCPLTFRIRNRRCRKLAYSAREKFLDVCIRLQTVIVFTCKVIRLISIFLVSGIFSFCYCFKSLKSKFSFKDINSSSSEADTDLRPDLSCFVLHLEGEDQLVKLMIANNCHATNHWIQKGKKKNPKHLINLLERTIISQGFKGISEFDSHQVPHLDCKEPPNSWALPIVTLTSIAISLPNISHSSIKQLVNAVNEGLPYIRLVEDNLDTQGDFINLKKAADIIWLGIDLRHKWLDVDLHKIKHHTENPKEILEKLSDYAKKTYAAEKKINLNLCLKLNPSNWPVKILAANCMYRISQSILLKYEKKYNQMNEELFAAVAEMISAIMGACFTNLHHVVARKCTNTAIEERERSVREAAYILGKTEKILKLVEETKIHGLNPDQMASIDEWRFAYKLEI